MRTEADFSSGGAGPALTIIHVITRFVRGGADENTLLSCNAQAEAGHNVVLVFGHDHSEEMLARLDPRVRRVWLPSLVRRIDPVRDVRALLALLGVIARLNPQIVHTHTSKAGILGRLAGHLAGAGAIVHGVHILPFVNVGRVERTAYLTLERLLDPLTDAFVSVSHDLRETCLIEHVGGPAAHAVVASGMDIERFRYAQALSPAYIKHAFNWSSPSQPQLLVMVAALEPRKRIIEFLRAFRHVVDERPNAVLAVLGEGIERLRALDEIEALGLADNVRLLGFRDDVERWIASASVCVLASEREGLPRSVVQYVLAAKPVVVSALPGIEVVVHEGRNGFVTDSDDLEAMCEPIIELLARPTLAQAFSSYAREMNLTAWSAEQMTTELEQIYARVLEERHPRPIDEEGLAWIS